MLRSIAQQNNISYGSNYIGWFALVEVVEDHILAISFYSPFIRQCDSFSSCG